MNHDVITVGLPMLAILAGIFFGRSDLKEFRTDVIDKLHRLEGRIDRLEGRFETRLDRIEGRLDRIDADLRTFYSVNGKLEARVEVLERQ